MGKIIEVYPRAGKTPHTAPVWQYDYGQIIHINGIELPASYKAEFSNTTRGDAIATVQTTDEITIPAQFLESGAAVYIWLVVVDESSRTTEYALIVPVAARAKPTDEEPPPEEQTEIEQTLAALNSGVSRVEQIAEAIPDTINDALAEAKASGEFDGADGADGKDGKDGKDGADGYTPQKGIDYFDGEDGKDGKDGKDGADGQTGPAGKDGAPGTPGADGTTFTPSVSAEGVISWTNDGGKPNPQPMNIKGPHGDDGTSPTVSVADISGGHRVTITDANGTRSFDVMDGEDYVLTAADKAEIAQQAAEEVDVPVQDVRVNGVSVLSDGLANVPIASANSAGVVKVDNQSKGLYINNEDKISIAPADESTIKTGTDYYKPIGPGRQHIATFYGLAKAAGSGMASSSNPVGTYTDEAKIAIQKMLGIYEAPWELIREDTFANAAQSDYSISVDGNGQTFELTDAVLMFETPTQNTSSSSSGDIYFYYGDNTYLRSGAGSWTQNANASPNGTYTIIENKNDMIILTCLYKSTSGVSSLRGGYSTDFNGNAMGVNLIQNFAINKITIKSILGTGHYKLYGKRKRN